MALWQAVLIGLFAYLGRNQVPWLFGTTGGWYGIGKIGRASCRERV